VVEQAKLGEDDEEAETPLAIVHLIKVEDHGNVSLDVDQLNLRSRSRVRDDLRHVELRGAEEEDPDAGEDQEEKEEQGPW
jgi:hypothetical protein